MAASSGARLRRNERLHAAAQFRRAFREGWKLDGALFLLLAVKNRSGPDRLGLVTGRRLGSAATRNRARRLLREAFRRNKPDANLDLVLVPKPGLAQRRLAEVELEFRERLRRLAPRIAGGRRRASAAAAD